MLVYISLRVKGAGLGMAMDLWAAVLIFLFAAIL